MYWTFDNKCVMEISYQSPFSWNSQKHKNAKYFLFCCGIELWCVNSSGHPDLLWSGCVEPESRRTVLNMGLLLIMRGYPGTEEVCLLSHWSKHIFCFWPGFECARGLWHFFLKWCACATESPFLANSHYCLSSLFTLWAYTVVGVQNFLIANSAKDFVWAMTVYQWIGLN